VLRRRRPVARRPAAGESSRPERPFRFGVTADRAFTATEWRAFARHVEDLGFSTLLVHDHLGGELALVPALAAAAETTTALRVGSLVACNDFRHPVVHARELATLDLLSDGRIEWGMGAGWVASEYAAAGIPFDPGPVRVDRLQEAVTVMKGLFADAPVSHSGHHFEIADLDGQPKPVQRPHPPLLVGGAGARMLRYAARDADIVGVAPSLTARRIGDIPASTSVEAAADRQVAWVKEAAGPRFDDLELNMVALPAIVTKSRAERAAEWSGFLGYEPEQVLASPHVWIGPVSQICDALEARRERWAVSYWVVPAGAADAVAPIVDRLAGH
jgi:probable F420-dependent oxidoreductase